MPRPKGSKNKKTEVPNIPNPPPAPPQKVVEVTREELMDELEKELKDESGSELVSIYEAASRMKTNEATVKLWVSHGHLKEINGRIPVRSIKECRINNTRRFR